MLVRSIVTYLFLLALPALAGEWSQWRGPSRDGVSEPIPDSLASLTKSWSVELGPSYSGPIVDADRVYVTETVGQRDEVVRAFDRETGKEIWRVSWPGSMAVPLFAAANGSWIRATPALADGRLFVSGMKDVLVGLDAATGDVLWKKDFPSEMRTNVPAFGNVPSPLVHDDVVITQMGDAVVALDVTTGAVRWKGMEEGGGRMSGGAFSSPIVTSIAGVEQLVVQSRSTLAGLDLTTGSLLWSRPVEAFRGMNILTPTVLPWGDTAARVFTSTYGGGSFMYEVRRDGGTWSISEIWSTRDQGYMSSPVVVGDSIFLHLRNQRVICFDAATGEKRWVSTPYGKYWSLLTDGSTLLGLDERGELIRVAADPSEFRVLETKKVSDSETWAHVALTDGQVFVRRLDGLDVHRSN